MKFKELFENDLMTISEVPLHIQELGDVFALVQDVLKKEPLYVVNHNGWKVFTSDGKEYNPLIPNNDPKEVLIAVSKDFQKPEVKYIVN